VAAAAPSTSAVAAAEAVAREQLHQLAFQRLQDVQQYGRAACEDAGVAFGVLTGTRRAHTSVLSLVACSWPLCCAGRPWATPYGLHCT
jgi:hypothetical protein